MTIPRLSIARPVAVAMFFIAITFLGVLSLSRLPVDLLPDVAYPKLVIYTTYPGVGPTEVERTITERIEARIARVPGRLSTESLTREGFSLITLRFAWGTDMDFATLNVREQLDGLRNGWPNAAEPPVVLRTDPRSEPIIAISVAGKQSLWTLKELAETVFRRRLEQIDGIAQAIVTGGLEREIHVEVDEQKLDSYGLTVEQVANALRGANTQSRSGQVLRGRYRYNLRVIGELQTVEEVGNVVIAQRTSSGASTGVGRVLVKDVALVSDAFRDRESIARYNGQESIGLLVFKESGANTVRVAKVVDEVLEQLRQEYPETTLQIATSQAGFISGAISNVIQQMVMGAVLAFLVLILFLRDPRYPVAISLAIPISVVSSFALLHAFGVSLNIMSLGGLALGIGMLVDNSIVVVENIFRHREKGLAAAAAAAFGTEEVQRAITASTLTTIAVFGPIIYVEGVAGELFKALSFSVAFSLIASLVVAVGLLPTLAARWQGKPIGTGSEPDATDEASDRPSGFIRIITAPAVAFDRVWSRFAGQYERALESALRHRVQVVVASVALLILTVPLALDLKRTVLPEVDQGEFRTVIELPLGTTLEATAETAGRLDELIRGDPAVNAVLSRIGRQVAIGGVDEENTGVHTAVLDVKLNAGEKASHAMERLRPKLNEFPPGSVTLEAGTATALGKLLGAGEADLAVRVRGEDLEGAIRYAQSIQTRLAEHPRLANVRVGTELGQPEFEVEVDRERAAAYGIDANAVVTFIDQHMRGTSAGDFITFDRKVPIVVRLPEAERRSLATLQTLRLRGVPISDLIDVRDALGPVEVHRLDQNRLVPVYADVRDGGVDEAVAAVQEVVNTDPPPEGLRVDVGGENEEMRRSFRDLGLAFALAVLLVYMILAAEFESFLHPFTVLLSVPLGLVGAIIALWAFGSGLNTVSLIGLVILVGIVDNDAVVKIDYINQLRRQGMATRPAILEAGAARLRPIVMNSLTAMIGITPMMIGLGPGAGLQAPLAIAIFGGLFTATALTLIVIPVVYELIDDLRVWLANRTGREAAAPGTMPDFAEPPESRTPEPVAGD
jgi:HAE1 family hydrophobic/amphiphilic exporter-1